MGNSTKPKAIYRNPTTKITVFKHVSQSNNNKKGTYIKYSCIHNKLLRNGTHDHQLS